MQQTTWAMTVTAIATLGLGATSVWGGGVIVPAGFDELQTAPGTSFDFGPPIGMVPFIGDPIGTAPNGQPFDTVVERLQDAMLPSNGSMDTIDIELVELSLKSVDPLNIGGNFFDVFVELDTSMPSTGSMTLELMDMNASPTQQMGLFDSTIDLWAVASFVLVGDTVPQFTVDIHKQLIGLGIPWTLDANGEFLILGQGIEVFGDGSGQHVFFDANAIPLPTGFALGIAGLAGLAGVRRRR